MGKLPSARTRRRDETLTGALIVRVCSRIFPKRNDENHELADYDELVPELARFGFHTRGQMQQLLTRNRRELMRIDGTPFSLPERQIYEAELGVEAMRRYIRGQFFYSYPAFVRVALEIEFGEAARGIVDTVEP